MMKRQIFISYSRANLEQVKAIKSYIEEATGADCWMDLEGIESGVPSFTKAIIEGIEQCDVFLFMRSQQSQDSKFALRELSYATEDAHKHVVIVNIDDSQMNKEFKFLYKYTDTINWNDQPQREKLIRDLRLWTGSRKNGGIQDIGSQPLPLTDRIRSFVQRFRGWLLSVGAILLLLLVLLLVVKKRTVQNEEGGNANQQMSVVDEALAQYHLNNFGEAFGLFVEAANQQNLVACYFLGLMCENGQGTEKNYVEAAKWYNEAAKLGHADSQLRLGMLYFNGKGVPEDDSEALRWFHEAARQENLEAEYMLGEMYNHGWGVTVDETTAVKWYKLAAQSDDTRAQNALGKIYSKDYGLSADYEEALKWYKMSAEQGDAKGEYELGEMYRCGMGVAQDYAEAMKWFLKSAEQDYQEAQIALASMYANGEGTPVNETEARKWYLKARGDADTIRLE